MIFGPHHPLDIEPDPARFGRGERREGLGIAREQPAAEGAQFPLLDDETELDRIEPQPSEEIRGAQLFGAQSRPAIRSEEHTSELQSLMRISYAVFCLKKKHNHRHHIQRLLVCQTHTQISYDDS